VPILSRLGPDLGHLFHGDTSAYLRFGEIFDLPRLSSTLGVPILEWDDVKNLTSDIYDEIGCWSVWHLAVGDVRWSIRGLDTIKLGMLSVAARMGFHLFHDRCFLDTRP
jgi:hypothetical protein